MVVEDGLWMDDSSKEEPWIASAAAQGRGNDQG